MNHSKIKSESKSESISAIINAGELITAHAEAPKTGENFSKLDLIKNGAIVFQGHNIIDLGTTGDMLQRHKIEKTIDAGGRVVMPGLVDPHTHLVHMGTRHEEYEYKISGKSYADLHKVGGIRYTVGMTRAASEEDLYQKALGDLDIMLLYGTTTVEVKSGYGLDRDSEMKLLRVAGRLKENHPIEIISTFLGAHTVPEEYKENKSGYVQLVHEMLKKAAPLVDFCDVWCDGLGFSVEDCRNILVDAQKHGLKLKLHVEQTGWSGGGELAAEMQAVSADHLDFLSHAAMIQMADQGVVGVLLPGVTYHLMEFKKDIPVKAMIESGMALALATDYNPGTCRTQSMQAILEAACRLYRMTYAQAINAATLNAAYALGRGDRVGSLAPGKQADFIILNCTEHGEMINNFGINHVHTVVKKGQVLVSNGQRITAIALPNSAPVSSSAPI